MKKTRQADYQQDEQRRHRRRIILIPPVLLLFDCIQNLHDARHFLRRQMKTTLRDTPRLQRSQTPQQRIAAQRKQRVRRFVQIKQQIAQRQTVQILIPVPRLPANQKNVSRGNRTPFAMNQMIPRTAVYNHQFRKFVAVQPVRLLRIPSDQLHRKRLVRQKVGI